MSQNFYCVVSTTPDLLSEDQHALLMGHNPQFEEYDARNVYKFGLTNQDMTDPFNALMEHISDNGDEACAVLYTDEYEHAIKVYGMPQTNGISINIGFDEWSVG